MTRTIIVFVLLAGLLSLAVLEQTYIGKTYATLRRDTEALYAVLNDHEDTSPVDTDEYKNKIDAIYNFWSKKEKNLCFVAKHLDLSYVSDAIIYAKNFIYFNDRKEACAGLARLIYLIDTHKHNIGTSIQNVI